MSDALYRSLVIAAAWGLLSACDVLEPPEAKAPAVEVPAVVAPVKQPVAKPAPAPVKKKPPVVIDFDDGGSGGGGWS